MVRGKERTVQYEGYQGRTERRNCPEIDGNALAVLLREIEGPQLTAAGQHSQGLVAEKETQYIIACD